jgi:hypothetical protein
MFSIFKIEAGEIKPIVIAGSNIATVKDYEEHIWNVMDEQLEYQLEEFMEDRKLDNKLFCLDCDIEEVYEMIELAEDEEDELLTCVFYNEKYYTLRDITA